MDVKAIKALEGQLTEARGKAKTELVGEIQSRITQLQDLGFGYELSEKKRTGRPRKEKANAVAMVQRGS